MNTISLQLPDSLVEGIKRYAKTEGISFDQFITSAIAEKLSAFATQDYLEERAKRADEKKFQEALAHIPDVEPEEYDKL